MSALDILVERGFIAQITRQEEIRTMILNKQNISFYIGYDPTADSLHIGHLLSLMATAYMQKAGHKVIALIGGATALIGDPSGKTDMRKMLSKEEIRKNSECFKKQMTKFFDLYNNNFLFVNNADWALSLKYIDVLKDLGVCFSVNKMLTTECYKQRLKRGLSFLELNYMIMQAYDFLYLYRNYNCLVQFGGDDQWSNILAGVDLIRRKEHKQVYGLTFNLLTALNGKKMGKTEQGTIWLDKEKTTSYNFYQYWRNINDKDVKKCLSMFTFLPMDEIKRLGLLRDNEINYAKKILAYEVTKLVHGEYAARKAQDVAEALFTGKGNIDNAPTIEIHKEGLKSKVIDILTEKKLFSSKGEARRLIYQGGFYINNKLVSDVNCCLEDYIENKERILIRKGKKTYIKISII